ncbi:MAG: amidohydrolase family protein [Acidobacteriaceae bacterium]|nr:amidohydrolase family protein [Acidobacteriaceae bacterium]
MKESRKAINIDVRGSIVMPGFVDASVTVSRDQRSLTQGSNKTKKPRQMYDDGLALMRSCLQHGTLTAEVKAGAEANDFRSDISVLRQLAKVGKNPVEMIRTWRVKRWPQQEQELRDFEQTLETLTRRKLVQFVEFVSGSMPGVERELLDLVREAKLAVKLVWEGGCAAVLETLLKQADPHVVMCSSALTPEEISLLASSRAILVFAPASELGRPSGHALRELADRGAAIALSSGYDEKLSPGFSMQMALWLAIVQGQLTAEQAITAATVNAAHAVGCGDFTGTIECGKRADILVMMVPDYRDISRQFGINHVGLIVRNGTLVSNRTRFAAAASR